ncbi:response regulator [Algoriphagus formosus]|uniref:response regulator n=1 Tax=Algoriphagus formosus TaxID=2007308 RepID=UPI003F7298AC
MPKLILIDDDRIQHLLFKKQLMMYAPSWEFNAFLAPTEAMTWLQNNEVDLIISDLNLEEETGWEILSKIAKLSQAPIVFLTGHATSEDRLKTADFPQVKGLFEKPLSEEKWEEILSMIGG